MKYTKTPKTRTRKGNGNSSRESATSVCVCVRVCVGQCAPPRNESRSREQTKSGVAGDKTHLTRTNSTSPVTTDPPHAHTRT
ncbi:hypothetical protein E2C01_094087 [Portunus trituberculatus]|uniref:Uncharacterized protein n=1 Tax=Portunus trituberculatus TaxID=210409 RepID=A0A5B7JZW2_PORTR|nr:hypothetical protein [Portunus trituberculatus]